MISSTLIYAMVFTIILIPVVITVGFIAWYFLKR